MENGIFRPAACRSSQLRFTFRSLAASSAVCITKWPADVPAAAVARLAAEVMSAAMGVNSSRAFLQPASACHSGVRARACAVLGSSGAR